MKRFKKAMFCCRHRKGIVTAIQGCSKVPSVALNVYPRFVQSFSHFSWRIILELLILKDSRIKEKSTESQRNRYRLPYQKINNFVI